MKNKTKLIDNVSNFLHSERGFKKSWMRSFFVILFLSAIFGVILGISYNLGPLANPTIPSGVNYIRTLSLPTNAKFLNVATYISIAGICLMVFPFICGFATWMIGINQVTRSSFFHLFIWLCIGIAGVLAMIALVLFIRSSIFNANEFPNTDVSTSSYVSDLMKGIINAK